MSNSIVFKMDRNGYKALLQSQEAMDVCVSYAENIASRCPPVGYAVNTMVGKTRVNAMVYPETKEAIADNYQNNTLLKARGV